MKKALLTWALAVFAGATAHANLVLSDSFNYAGGPLVDAPGSPWLAYLPGTGQVLATNSQVRLTGGGSEGVHAPLAGGPYLSNSTAVLYSSFKIRLTSQPGNLGTWFAQFMDTNSGAAAGWGARVWLSATNAYTGTLLTNNSEFRIGIANGVLGSAQSGQFDTNLSLTATNTIVTRFVPKTGLATLWLNPVTESSPSVTATDPGTLARPNPIDVVAYGLRQNTGEGTVFLDDLRVGTSFSDVTSTNHLPDISGIPRQSTAAGVPTAAIPFTVGDTETPAANLTLSGSSSNPSLVLNPNIVFGGSGSNRTVTITPQPGQQGFALITLTVTDGDGGFSTSAFQLAVGVPAISDIPNQITPISTPLGSIPFTVSDTEAPAGSLVVNATSGNQALLPDANLLLGGSGSNRTLSLAPASGLTGLATVALRVSDGTSSSTNTFVLTVYPLLGVLRTDDFNRADSPLVQLDGQWLSNGGSSGTHTQEMQIISGALQVTGTQSEDCSTEMPAGQASTPAYPPASGTILYVSMKVNYQVLPNASGAYFAHFRDGNNGFRGRIYAATTGAAAGHYRLGVANSANSISPAALMATDLATNQSYTIVLRYNVGTGESCLWLNPVSEASPGVEAVDPAQPLTVEAFRFRQNSDIGTVLVDDLKIGTAFWDVVAVPPVLHLSMTNSNAQLLWPASYTGYLLQGRSNLVSGSWSNVTNAPFLSDGNKVVVLTNLTGNRFFRLSQ